MRNDTKRERFRKAKTRIEKLSRARESIEKPYRDAIKVATKHLLEPEMEAEEEYDLACDDLPEFCGKCETCGIELFEGDKAFRYSDDEVYLCVEHAPTFADCAQNIRDCGPDSFEEGQEEYDNALAHCLAQPPTEKSAWTL